MGRRFLLLLFLFGGVVGCALGGDTSTSLTSDGMSSDTPHVMQPGLYVDANGTLMHDGRAYRGIGVNYFNALFRMLEKKDTSYRAGFTYLKAHHIPFIRFMGGCYWPKQWDLYKTNKTEYFARYDEFVKDAERAGIGLIPCMFMQVNTVPDLVGEPVNQWGNSNSKTIAFMRNYTTEVVSRYRNSPAIWGWEMGNEMNLEVDLPEYEPQISVENGTPPTRSAADRISTADMKVALEDFGKTVRGLDKSRIIVSGNSQPRPEALHLNTTKSWKPKDTIEEYKTMLARQNPAPLDTLTIHVYPQQEFKSFADMPASLGDILRVSMDGARALKKPLYLEEFGASKEMGPEKGRGKFAEFLNAIEKLRVPLASMWVFDYAPQGKDWNVTPDNGRQYQIEEVGDLNDRMEAEDK